MLMKYIRAYSQKFVAQPLLSSVLLWPEACTECPWAYGPPKVMKIGVS